MSAEVTPALTPEEWAEVLASHVGWDTGNGLGAVSLPSGVIGIEATHCGCEIDVEHNHRAAALALHGQPFGFTWADVDALHNSANHIAVEFGEPAETHVKYIRSIADKIAALLPPRENQ